MSSILVVEEEGFVVRLLQDALGDKGYHIVMIPKGEDAVQFALREMPALIVLDTVLPGWDDYELIRRLRDHPKCMHIPLIMVSYDSLTAKVRAFELGVDSYITKPFSKEELLAHIHRQLSRVQQTSLSPLTRLPGGLQLERAIDYKLRSLEPWSVLYLDLNNFKAFNDVYGFLSGNDMILLVSDICQRVVYEYGNCDDFVGHVGGDDFVIVTTPDREAILCECILERYRQESVVLYRDEDLQRGTICGVDRNGRPFQFPLVSLSIGVVNDWFRCPRSMNEIGMLVAKAKSGAKKSSSNVFAISSKRRPVQEYTPLPASGPSIVRHIKRDTFSFAEKDALAEI